MKRYYYFIAFVLMTICCQTLISCGDDDGGVENSICGTWKCVSDSKDGSHVGDILYIDKDNTYKFFDSKYNGAYENGSWSLNGNQLMLMNPIPIAYTITELTSNKLSFKFGGYNWSFIRQSDPGDSGSGAQFVINGKAYNLSSNQLGVFWYKSYGSGIQICTGTYGKTNPDEIYTFGFLACKNDTYCEPTVGLDISKLEYSYASMTLKFHLEIRDTKAKTNTECEYVSGSLIIVDINKSKETITLKFNDLKMRSGGDSYMFNGTITLPLHIS